MLRNRILQLTLLLITSFINPAFADDVQYATITIMFNTYNKYLLSQQYSIGSDYDMSCLGMNNAYSLSSNTMSADLDIMLTIKGPFKGDKRTSCKIYDNYAQANQDVYFIIGTLPINFIYNNQKHMCNIQQIGTSYGGLNNYSVLVGQYPSMPIPCTTESGNLDTYTFKNNAIYINVPK